MSEMSINLPQYSQYSQKLSSKLRMRLIIEELKAYISKKILTKSKVKNKVYAILRILKPIIVFLYSLLVFFEKPPHCYRKTTFSTNTEKKDDECPEGLSLMNKNIFLYNPLYRGIELVFFIIILVTQILFLREKSQLKKYGKIKYKILQIIIIIIIFVCYIEVLVSMIFDFYPMINFFLRGILIILLIKSLRHTWRCIFSIIYKTKSVFFLVITNVIFFGILGHLLFKSEDNKDFSTVFESIYSLLILLTACNFPDVMIKTFTNTNKLSAIFFCCYVFLNFFLLFSLLKTLYYSKYSEYYKNKCLKNIGHIVEYYENLGNEVKLEEINVDEIIRELEILNKDELSVYSKKTVNFGDNKELSDKKENNDDAEKYKMNSNLSDKLNEGVKEENIEDIKNNSKNEGQLENENKKNNELNESMSDEESSKSENSKDNITNNDDNSKDNNANNANNDNNINNVNDNVNNNVNNVNNVNNDNNDNNDNDNNANNDKNTKNNNDDNTNINNDDNINNININDTVNNNGPHDSTSNCSKSKSILKNFGNLNLNFQESFINKKNKFDLKDKKTMDAIKKDRKKTRELRSIIYRKIASGNSLYNKNENEDVYFENLLISLNHKYNLSQKELEQLFTIINSNIQSTSLGNLKNNLFLMEKYKYRNQMNLNIIEQSKFLKVLNQKKIEIIINLIDSLLIFLLIIETGSNVKFYLIFLIPQTIWCCFFIVEFGFFAYYFDLKTIIFKNTMRAIFYIFNFLGFLCLFLLFILYLVIKPEKIEDSSVCSFFFKTGKILIILRTCRIFILFSRFTEFETMFKTITNMKSSFYGLFSTLFSFYFMFTTLSMALTGGHIYINSFENSDSIPQNYHYINFNDFGSGYVACFALTMVNNINIIGVSLSTGVWEWFKLYFAFFYFISTNIILNIGSTLLLEMYLTLKNKVREVKTLDANDL